VSKIFDRIEKYTALIMQPHVEVASDREGIKRNLERSINLIDFGAGYHWELPTRLVVFPEYFLLQRKNTISTSQVAGSLNNYPNFLTAGLTQPSSLDQPGTWY
jgi:hypothetical protein